MVLVSKFDTLGLPPQLKTTITGLNSILSDLGFPKWTLVRWPVPPLLTVWLFLTLLMSGLRWFAIFEIMFILYKFFEEYGDPVSDWVHNGGMRDYVSSHSRPRSISRSPNETSSSRSPGRSRPSSNSRSTPRKTTTFEHNDDDDSDS